MQNDMTAAGKRSVRGAGPGAKPEPAPPPVLPGTKSASQAAAPSVLPADMSPTDALFDAVNRGDLQAARDAVRRGANMDARNLLGLTAVEQSVDLGRNDITFVLLSMRGEDTSPSNRSGQKAPDQRVDHTPKAASRQRVAATPIRAPAEPDPVAPRVYSGNGGVPIPAAGFLGFDEGKQVR